MHESRHLHAGARVIMKSLQRNNFDEVLAPQPFRLAHLFPFFPVSGDGRFTRVCRHCASRSTENGRAVVFRCSGLRGVVRADGGTRHSFTGSLAQECGTTSHSGGFGRRGSARRDHHRELEHSGRRGRRRQLRTFDCRFRAASRVAAAGSLSRGILEYLRNWACTPRSPAGSGARPVVPITDRSKR